ncbi:MAG TPA: DUF302 domain-containing protein [Polyangiaceae bacterium]|nr:DUF302 domain-containing protein [Polyangiaceae bacterium]
MKNNPISERAHRGSWHALPVSFDTAVERLPPALRAEGFGIITQIDLQQTFKEKLGVDFRRYRIFGACNPAFALKALELDPRAGLLLPCNVVLFESEPDVTMLGIIDPVQQLDAPSGPLSDLAGEIEVRLARVARTLARRYLDHAHD